jgi:hypothetical protein
MTAIGAILLTRATRTLLTSIQQLSYIHLQQKRIPKRIIFVSYRGLKDVFLPTIANWFPMLSCGENSDRNGGCSSLLMEVSKVDSVLLGGPSVPKGLSYLRVRDPSTALSISSILLGVNSVVLRHRFCSWPLLDTSGACSKDADTSGLPTVRPPFRK